VSATSVQTGGYTYPAAERRRGIGAVVVAALGLSSGSTLVKLAGAPGPVVAFWRLTFASLIWVTILLCGKTRVTRAELRRMVPAGVVFGLNLLLFFSAVRATRVANAEFITTLTPVFAVPLAALVLKEHVRWRPLLLGIPAMFGVALIVFNAPARGSSSAKGDLLALGAVFTWSLFLLATKRVRRDVTTTQFMATITPVATLVVLPFAINDGGLLELSAKGWAMCVLLAVVTGTLAHGLVVWAQRHVELSTITVIQVSQPALAAGWAWLLLGESVAPVQMVGMVVVLGSLTVFTYLNTR
jgi:drug/metabolite transporter (DMT)-like permease